MSLQNPNLGYYLGKNVSELIVPENYLIDEGTKERHRLYSLLLMSITKNYWNGNKEGREGESGFTTIRQSVALYTRSVSSNIGAWISNKGRTFSLIGGTVFARAPLEVCQAVHEMILFQPVKFGALMTTGINVRVNYHKTEDSSILSNSLTVTWIWVSEIPLRAMTLPASCF